MLDPIPVPDPAPAETTSIGRRIVVNGLTPRPRIIAGLGVNDYANGLRIRLEGTIAEVREVSAGRSRSRCYLVRVDPKWGAGRIWVRHSECEIL